VNLPVGYKFIELTQPLQKHFKRRLSLRQLLEGRLT